MPRYEIRAACREDEAELYALARYLNTVNLPDDRDAIAQILDISERSFTRRNPDPASASTSSSCATSSGTAPSAPR